MKEVPASLTAKYYKGRVIFPDRTIHYIVWDGGKDYSHLPPCPGDGLVFELVMRRLGLPTADPGQLVIAQISNRKFGNWHLQKLMETKPVALIIWTKDHATFKAISKNLERESLRMQ
jgi:hypothetical protein